MSRIEPYFELIHRSFPPGLRAACRPHAADPESSTDLKHLRRLEREAGRKLVGDLVRETIGPGSLTITTDAGGKPVGTIGGAPLHLSISHCPTMICGVISRSGLVGIDVERADRRVDDSLRVRITSPEEEILCRDMPLVRLWGIKESALKWCGSGIRHAMNRVSVINIDGDRFMVRLMDGRLVLCVSTLYRSHWISVACTPLAGQPDTGL